MIEQDDAEKLIARNLEYCEFKPGGVYLIAYNWTVIATEWIDEATQKLKEHGVHIYLLKVDGPISRETLKVEERDEQ